MSEQKFFLRNDSAARQNMVQVMDCVRRMFDAGLAVRVVVKELQPNRTLDQNRKFWAMLNDIAEQVSWPVDGRDQRLEPDEWKEIVTAGLRKNQRVAAGIEGGFVMLGSRTSRMTIAEMAELIEFIQWFGTERGVRWTDPKIQQEAA